MQIKADEQMLLGALALSTLPQGLKFVRNYIKNKFYEHINKYYLKGLF
jgi:hypothetical protein